MPADLSSWKEIAAYLGVSIRTAQLWEKEAGLPVSRIPGRNHVFATPADLDRWKLSRQQLPPPASQPDTPPVSPTQPFWLKLAAALTLSTAAFTVFLASSRAIPPQPFLIRPLDSGFQVLDATGNILWSKTFPSPILTSNDCSGFPGLIADLDLDGRNEVLFLPNHTKPNSGPIPLICYRADGRELWRFTPSFPLRTSTSSFTNEFRGCSITALPPSTGAAVALGSLHSLYHPFQLAFLSPQGKLLRQFWHAGHLQAATLHDIDADGVPELLLAGVSNARRLGTLLALDPRSTHGAAPESLPQYQFLDLPIAHPKARLFFPRTALSQNEPYTRAFSIHSTPQNITVHVNHSTDYTKPIPTVYYHFSPRLAFQNVSLSDVFATSAKQLNIPLPAEQLRLQAILQD